MTFIKYLCIISIGNDKSTNVVLPIYSKIINIENDKKQMWFCHLIFTNIVGEVVMFMVKVILFLILSLIFSLALNVALAAVLYKNWVDKQLHK